MSRPRPVPRSRTFTRALTFPVEKALGWELHAQRLHWVLIDRAEALLRARFPEQTRALPDYEGTVTVPGRRRPSFHVRLKFYVDRIPIYHSRESAPIADPSYCTQNASDIKRLYSEQGGQPVRPARTDGPERD